MKEEQFTIFIEKIINTVFYPTLTYIVILLFVLLCVRIFKPDYWKKHF